MQSSFAIKQVKVLLLGGLGDRFGTEYELHLSTPADAIKLLVANFGDEFVHYLYESEKDGVAFRVVVDSPDGIDEARLHMPITTDKLIISTEIQGAGGGLGKLFLGGALLVGSFFMPATLSIFGASISSTAIGVLGASMVFGGISQMLTPVPKTPKEREEKQSYLINSAAGVSTQGLPVPWGCGRGISMNMPVLSVSVDTEEIR